MDTENVIELVKYYKKSPTMFGPTTGLATTSSVVIPKPKRGLNKTKGGKDIVYLIDADTHAYRAAAATDGRRYAVGDGTSPPKFFKYKKDAVASCVSMGLDEKRDILLEFLPEPDANAIKLLQDSLEEFSGRTTEYFVTGKRNFRYDIAPDYKGNRKGGRVPKNLTACKSHLMKIGAVLNTDLEADDAVICRAKELERVGIPFVIVGCDKDLLQIPGIFYDPFSKKRTVVTKEEARFHLWKQIAIGDSTDNIRSAKGVGPATFKKWFKDVDWELHTDWDLLCMMIGLYKSKVKQEEGESENNYTCRIMMWVKTVASLVFLRRAPDEPYQLPRKDGKGPDRSTRVGDTKYI